MKMLKPNSIPFFLLHLLLLFSFSSTSSPPQCKNKDSSKDPQKLKQELESGEAQFTYDYVPVPPSLTPSPGGPTEYYDPIKEKELYNVCSRTEHLHLCLDLARTFAAAGPIQGPVDVLNFELQALEVAIKNALIKHEAFNKPKMEDSEMERNVMECRSQFIQVMAEIGNVQKAIERNERGKLGSLISGLAPKFSNCADDFSKLRAVFEEDEVMLEEVMSIIVSIKDNYFSH